LGKCDIERWRSRHAYSGHVFNHHGGATPQRRSGPDQHPEQLRRFCSCPTLTSQPYANAHPHANAHPDVNTDTVTHTVTDTVTHTVTDTVTHTVTHTNANAHPHA
jgi:hypothetical protein